MPTNKSSFLLIAQLTLIGLIFLSAGVFANNPLYTIIQILGLILGLWATYILFTKSKFNAFAEVREDAKLVTSGPLKYIRNPIYTSILLLQVPQILENLNIINIVLLFTLIIVLILKINIEERSLSNKFKQYTEYRSNTKRLIPFLY